VLQRLAPDGHEGDARELAVLLQPRGDLQALDVGEPRVRKHEVIG